MSIHYVVRKCTTVEELKEAEFDYLLELAPESEVLGHWQVTPEEVEPDMHTYDEVEIEVMYNVDKYLHTHKVKALLKDEKTAFITEEVLNSMM